MIKKSIVSLLICLVTVFSFSQDSLLSIKTEIKDFDSLVENINLCNKHKEVKIIGNSRLKGEYTGVVYKDFVSGEVSKVKIFYNSGEEAEIFSFQKKIIKAIFHSDEYYYINSIFYNRSGSKILRLDVIAHLLDLNSIFKVVIEIS